MENALVQKYDAILNDICSMEYPDSAWICTSRSIQPIVNYHRENGHVVIVLNPFSNTFAAGEGHFNPLTEVRADTLFESKDIHVIAASLLDPYSKGLNDVAQKLGFSWVVLAITYLLRLKDLEIASLMDVAEFLSEDHILENLLEDSQLWKVSQLSVQKSILKVAKELALNPSADLYAGLVEARNALRPYAAMKGMVSSNFRLLDLQDEKKPVTLIMQAQDEATRGLAALVTNMLLSRLMSAGRLRDGESVAGHELMISVDNAVVIDQTILPYFSQYNLLLVRNLF